LLSYGACHEGGPGPPVPPSGGRLLAWLGAGPESHCEQGPHGEELPS
jgi:hypothetical protein